MTMKAGNTSSNRSSEGTPKKQANQEMRLIDLGQKILEAIAKCNLMNFRGRFSILSLSIGIWGHLQQMTPIS